MTESISITDRIVGDDAPPFVIAELSGNHNQSLDRALALVDAAAGAGAHGLKVQTYTADTMTLDIADGAFRIDDPTSLWHGRTLYALYHEAHTPWEWHAAIFDRARTHGMIPFSTPFDHTAVDFLETLDAPLYKIASFEVTDTPLIRRVAETGKPMLISTGMASIEEIQLAVDTALAVGNNQIVLLKCTSSYPAPASDLNLLTIPAMRERFGCLVGLSDHTRDNVSSIVSIALGATVIEKHMTLDRTEGGVDSAFSLEPNEFATLVQESEVAWTARGQVHFGVTSPEEGSLQFRRSLYCVRDIAQGEPFTSENVRAIRPGFGLPPSTINAVLGSQSARAITKGTPITWELIDSAQ